MKCPYCAEEIKDEAIFCRHCNHDFGLIKPLLAQLIKLEKQVTELKDALAINSVEGAPSYAFAALLSVALCVLFTSGYLLLSMRPPLLETNLARIFTILLPPLVMGLAAGLAWNRESLRSYLPSGLALGALNLACAWSSIKSFEGLDFRWLWGMVVFAFGQPFTFATSALVGKYLHNRWSSGPSSTSGGSTATSAEAAESIMKRALLATGLFSGIVACIKGALELFERTQS